MEINLIKVNSWLVPHTPEDIEAFSKIEPGRVVSAKLKLPRNYEFHKKLFALITFAFENMPASELQKSYDVFRNDLMVLAGHYDQVFSLNGKGFKLVGKSHKYSKMTEEEKQKVYSDLCNVILDKVLPSYTLSDLLNGVDEKAKKFSGFL